MPELRTLYVTLILTDFALALILTVYGKTYRTYPGYMAWLLSIPVYCCSLILIMFRNSLPGPVSLILSTFLFILAFVMRLDAIRRFFGKKPLHTGTYALFLGTALAFSAYCAFELSSHIPGNAPVSLTLLAWYTGIALLAIGVLCSIPLVSSDERETRTIRVALSGVFAVISLLYLIRAATGFTVYGKSTVLFSNPVTFVYYYCLILTDISATCLFVLLNMARSQSELARSESLARESEEKYRGVVTSATDGIVVIRDGIVRFLNPKAAAIFGRTEAECVDRPFLSFIDPREQNRVAKIYNQRITGLAVPELYETTAVTPGGDPVEIELNARLISLEGKSADLLFIRDIRERKRSEKALEHAREKLAILNDVIFKDISNDILSLSGYQQIIRETVQDRDAPVAPFLEKEEEVLRMTNSSLRFARTYQDLGRIPAKWQDVRFVFLSAFSHTDTLKLKHQVKTEDLEVFADPYLERVFQILTENVLAHGKTATLISIGYRAEPDESLTLIFEDNGAGIADDEKTGLFLPPTPTRRSAGLFLAHEILEITDMRIRETGEFGKGARFEIHVPKGMFRFHSKES